MLFYSSTFIIIKTKISKINLDFYLYLDNNINIIKFSNIRVKN